MSPDDKPAVARALRASDLSLSSTLLRAAIEADRKELVLLRSQKVMPIGAERIQSEGETFLEQRIGESRQHLERVEGGELDFFAYDTHFSHVMEEGGFGIIAGNPPWIRSRRIEPNTRKMLSIRYAFFRGSGERKFQQADLSIAFCERAISLSAPDGVISFLMPAKITNAGYASALRTILTRKHTLLALQDWSDESKRLFEADTFPLGLTFTPAKREKHQVEVTRGDSEWRVATSELSIHESSSEWSLVPPECMRVLRRLSAQLPNLHDLFGRQPLMGVKTGANERFFLPEVRFEDGALRVSPGNIRIPVTSVCRCVRGRDIRRWKSEHSTWMLWPPARGWDSRVEWVRNLLTALKVSSNDLRLSYVRPEHLGIKVAWKDVSRGLQAVVLPDSVEIAGASFPLVPNQTTYFLDAVSMDEAFLLSAILNSALSNVFAVCLAERAKDFHYRYFGVTVGALPIPRVDPSSVTAHDLIRLARRAHQGEEVDEEIDDIIFSLVGVSGIERLTLESYLNDRLGHTPRL